MLTTLTCPTAGTALVAGHDLLTAPEQVRARIGVTFQEIVLDQDLTGRAVLDIHGKLYREPSRGAAARLATIRSLCRHRL